ncbi:MAG: hypothetical protein JXR83_12910 [Deltaproteobacteria bacterium]|nr:hypothetical protein [Deltaproteobacteria bacterium]
MAIDVRRRSRQRWWWCCVLAAAGIAAVGRASVVERLSLQRLVELADRIVVARVGAGQARFDGDGRTIVTDTVVQVETTLKGTALSRLTVRTSGGVVGDLGQLVAGSARLSEGGRALLFLEERGALPDGTVRCRTIGMAQGVYHLVIAADGRELAARDLRGMAELDVENGDLTALAPEASEVAADLLVRIRSALAHPAAGSAP